MIPAIPPLIQTLGATQYVVFPENMTKSGVAECVHTLGETGYSRDFFADPNIKLRFVYDDLKIEKWLLDELQKYETIKHCFYNTHHFFKPISELIIHDDLDVEIVWVNYINTPEYVIAENFLFEGRGVIVINENGITEFQPDTKKRQIIQQQLDRILYDSTFGKVILIKFNGLWVGCFYVVEVNSDELQLHDVTGKSTLKDVFMGKKLPLLMEGLSRIVAKDYGNTFEQKNFRPYKRITFSNNNEKVSALYEACGFERMAGRKCVLVEGL